MLNNYKTQITRIEQEQKELCRKYEADFQPIDFNLRFGFSDNFFSGIMPLNGLRHPQDGNMCGWYFWAGEEFFEADDFFKPMHVYHLIDRSPNLLKYLALPEGWRFLAVGDYEDVWFDENLLKI